MTDEEVRQEYESLLYRERCTFEELLLRRDQLAGMEMSWRNAVSDRDRVSAQLAASRAEVARYREVLTRIGEQGCEDGPCQPNHHSCAAWPALSCGACLAQAALDDSRAQQPRSDSGPTGIRMDVAPDPEKNRGISPADHLQTCGPLCAHVEACPDCLDIFGICDKHADDPDGTWSWLAGIDSAGDCAENPKGDAPFPSGKDDEHKPGSAAPAASSRQIDAQSPTVFPSPEASPRPWRVGINSLGCHTVQDANGWTLAEMANAHDAALVVEAVNSFGSRPAESKSFGSPLTVPAAPPAPSPETPPGDADPVFGEMDSALRRVADPECFSPPPDLLAALSRAREAHRRELDAEWNRALEHAIPAVCINRGCDARSIMADDIARAVRALRRPESAE